MKDNILNYLTNDYIYLPYDKNMKLNYKENDYVYKDDVILEDDNNIIYSSVSGKLLGLTTINNNKYLVIENDYKDKTRIRKGTKRNINKYTKDELINLINKYNIIDNFDINSKVLIISSINEYIEEITYNTLLKEYTIEILDTIDALIEIMNIRKCFLAVTTDDVDLVNILVNNIGTYPKIDMKLVTNNYYIGNKNILINKLTNYKNKNYNMQFLSIKDILNIYYILKKDKYPSETYITVSGNLIDYTKVIRVKIGTNINDILYYLNIDNKNNIIINGLLNGIHLKDTNYIIDKNIRSIFINTIEKTKELKCINCGLCIESCPVNINPKYMYFNNDQKAMMYKKKCINCGLCSYNCPSKINLVNGGKNDKK